VTKHLDVFQPSKYEIRQIITRVPVAIHWSGWHCTVGPQKPEQHYLDALFLINVFKKQN
jgi:hypothetical protein